MSGDALNLSPSGGDSRDNTAVSAPTPDARDIQHGLPAQGVVEAPRSKSHAIRLLVAAALADGVSTVWHVPQADDVLSVLDALRALGIEIHEDGPEAVVHGCGGTLPDTGGKEVLLHLGGSGTGLRVMTAICCLGRGPYVLDGDTSLRSRPVGSVVDVVRGLGCHVRTTNGRPPLQVSGGPARLVPESLTCPDVTMSSQPLSALLLAAAALPERPYELWVPPGHASLGYVDLTLEALASFGVRHRREEPLGGGVTLQPGGGGLRPADVTVEGDWSSAAYLLAAAAVSGGEVRVTGLHRGSRQPDALILRILERMGAVVEAGDHAVRCHGVGPLRGIRVSLQGAPDLAPLVGALGCVAEGVTEVYGAPHLRIKETDRIAAVVAAAQAVGRPASERDDGFVIEGRTATGGDVDPRGDHRLAMAFAVAGLAIPAVRISDPGCVAKSYPGFWADLARLTGGE